MKHLVTLLLISSQAAWAAPAPKDFALRLTVQADAPASLLRVELPEAVYRATRRSDLADVRVFNAAGEALPMARLPRDSEARERRLDRPLVALPPRTSGDGGAVVVTRKGAAPAVQVDIGASAERVTSTPGYVIDSEGFDAPIDRLIVHWPGAPVFEAALQVEASDDLARWRTVVSRAPVLAIGVGEARIEQAHIDLPAVKARYLRLNWLADAPDVALQRVTLVHRTAPGVAREWVTVDGQADVERIAYVSPGLFPVDAVRLLPVGENDVQPATLYSRPAVSARWRWRGAVLGYRLTRDGAAAEAPPHTLAMTRDPLWRAVLDAGAPAASPPRLELGWVPEAVVFVARGAGPYTLAAGHDTSESVWRAPAQVVPGFGTAQAAAVGAARLLPTDAPVPSTARASAPWQPGTHWWLWGALALGVIVLGAMARGLWRELRSPGKDAKDT